MGSFNNNIGSFQEPPRLGSSSAPDILILERRAQAIREQMRQKGGLDMKLLQELFQTDTEIESRKKAVETPESEIFQGLEKAYFDRHIEGAYSFLYRGDARVLIGQIQGDPRFHGVEINVALPDVGQATPVTVSWSTTRPKNYRNITIDSAPAANDAEVLSDVGITSITQPVRSRVRGLLSTLPAGEAANDQAYPEVRSGVVHYPFAQIKKSTPQARSDRQMGEIIDFPRASQPIEQGGDGIPLLGEDQLIEAGPRYRAESSDIAPEVISEQVYPYIPQIDPTPSSSAAPTPTSSRSLRERIASGISTMGKKIASWFRRAA